MREFGHWTKKRESRYCQTGLTQWKKTLLNLISQYSNYLEKCLMSPTPGHRGSPELFMTGTVVGWLHQSCSSCKAQIRMPWMQWVWEMAQQRWWGRRRAGGCPPSVGALPGAALCCDTGQPPKACSCLQHQPARFPEP